MLVLAGPSGKPLAFVFKIEETAYKIELRPSMFTIYLTWTYVTIELELAEPAKTGSSRSPNAGKNFKFEKAVAIVTRRPAGQV